MKAPTTTEVSEFLEAGKSVSRPGECSDAARILEQTPDVQLDRDAVLDLVLDDSWARRRRGEAIDVEALCGRFPRFRSSIRRMLQSEEMLGGHPSLVDGHPSLAQEATTEAPVVRWPEPGETLGYLKLIRRLGRGNFAHVYLATESSAGDRPVAVKISLHGGIREANTLGRIHHDHIVPILWADRDDTRNLHVVCMPFLGSATLNDVLNHAHPGDDSPLPERGAVIAEAIAGTVRPNDPQPDYCLRGPDLSRLSYIDVIARLAEQLAETLAFLHDRELVHYDLKPSNILLTPAGRPLVLDFNLSHRANAEAGHIGGTPHYMAPEQIIAWQVKKSLTIEEGCRADLYSLGVIVYELLTGRHPFGTTPEPGQLDEAALCATGSSPGKHMVFAQCANSTRRCRPGWPSCCTAACPPTRKTGPPGRPSLSPSCAACGGGSCGPCCRPYARRCSPSS